MKALIILPETSPYFVSAPTLIAVEVDELSLTMDGEGHGTVRLTGEYWGPIAYDPARPVNLSPAELEQAPNAIGNRPTDKENPA